MKNVKQKITLLWQNAETILIIVFFATFTLNIRKVFLTPYSFLNGGFNEYTTMSFSWADALMLATIVIYTTKSIFRQVINPYYASHGHEKVFGKSFINVSRETFYLLIFLGWIGLSIFWSQYRPMAIYRFLTLVEIALFACISIKTLKNNHWFKIAAFALILNGLFQSILGIAQFIHNGSLGLYAIGESLIGPKIDGVAKIMIDGEKHIRAYGTMPHPNILAGFLIVSLFLIFAEIIMRRLKVSHETHLASFPDSILQASGIIIGCGFILTFSRSAWLALVIGLALYTIWMRLRWHKHTLPALNFGLTAIFLVVLALTIFLFHKTSLLSDQSLQERNLYQIVSYETISSHPVAGVGIGQFIIDEYTQHPNLQSWQYQPVHNIYLLIFSELGGIGIILFLMYLISILVWLFREVRLSNNYRLTYSFFYVIILSFLFISLFDHYFWDLKLGSIIFALPLIIGAKREIKFEN